MTANPPLVRSRLRLFTGAAVFCVLLPAAVQASEGRYLNWQNKVAVPTPPAQNTIDIQGQSVPVPPSAYGQVGDPYARVLSWGTKNRQVQAAPQPVASAAPVNRQPVQRPPAQATAPVSAPEPAQPPRRASNYRDSWPQFAPAPMASTLPEPVQPQPLYEDPAPPRPAPPMVEAQVPQPVQAPALQQPAPVASADGGYQVPPTSKYAARIASARAAQTQPAPAPPKPEKLAQSEKPTKPAPVKAAKDAKAAPADMPAPVTQTASDGKPLAEDRPFVPGQHYTDASEAPRLYSLHRDYGLKPDPITVDNNASGALLDTSRLDATEAKAEKAESEAAGDAEPDDEADASTTDARKDAATRESSPSTKAAAKTAAASKVTPTP